MVCLITGYGRDTGAAVGRSAVGNKLTVTWTSILRPHKIARSCWSEMTSDVKKYCVYVTGSRKGITI